MGRTAEKARKLDEARRGAYGQRMTLEIGQPVSVPGLREARNRVNGTIAGLLLGRHVTVRITETEALRTVPVAEIGSPVEEKKFFRKQEGPIRQTALREAQVWHGPSWSNGG